MRPRTGLMAAVVLAIGGTASSQPASRPAQPAATQPTPAADLAPPAAPPPIPAPPAAPALEQPATAPAAPVTPAAPETPPAPVTPASAPASAPAFPATTQLAPPFRLGAPSDQSDQSLPPTTAPGGPTTAAAAPEAGEAARGQLGKVVVTRDLDKDRARIAPSLGAETFTLGPNQIRDLPGGENAPFQQVLLRAPGVVEDSFGQIHIRGEHANLTYRINGVLLPQPVNIFGQEIDTRIASSITLIDGSLPAQFGLHTAGIVDVTTKSGATLNHNELSLYGGSYDTIQPSIQLGGSVGNFDYFIVGSYNHNDLGIENPTSSHRALHDYTDQERLFAYLSWRLDETSRLSLISSNYYGDFEIPNSPGLPKAFTLAGAPASVTSAQTNENQNEQEYYDVLAYQKTINDLSYQVSGFVRYGQTTFYPDPINDLIFQGDAGAVYYNFATYGIQIDGSYILNNQHTIRAGFLGDYTLEKQDTFSEVFPVDASGAQTSDTPFGIRDNTGNRAFEGGVYLQDEFKLTPQLTVNYGLRYDRFDANFDDEDQVSPRVNVVWKIDDKTTAHAGYSRYFVPPPVQGLTAADVNRFNGTTNAPASPGAAAPRVERSNYYDVGLSRQVTPALSLNVDGFYKQAKNLVDLGQFGPALINSPVNYRAGTVYGAELSALYKQGGFSGFANFSWTRTMAHDIFTQQFLIDPDELAFIRTHNIKLDHESEYTVSAGASYSWTDNRVYVDMLYGSGLRAGFANTQQEPQHYPVNIGYEHVFHMGGPHDPLVKFRFDVVNVFDQSYQLRQGGGLGVNADQFGQRRSFFAGLAYEF